MPALLLSLSNKETVAGRKKWFWKSQLLYRLATIFQVWELLPAPSLISLLNPNCRSIWSQQKKLQLPRPKLFCWRILSRELYIQPDKKPAARYSRNTKPNLPLPEDLKALAKSCENILHLTLITHFSHCLLTVPIRWCESLFHLPFNECPSLY